MQRPQDKTLIIFARAPMLGGVKTRLAATIGDQRARDVYQRLSRKIISELAGAPQWKTFIAATPQPCLRHRMFASATAIVMDQGRGDLGDRMARALQTAGAGSTILVGTDIPGLNVQRIQEAFKLLAERDVVFGPAEDGGYWLVGSRKPDIVSRMFKSVRWSTEHALSDTLANLHNGRVGILTKLRDLDDFSDLNEFEADALG